MNERTLFYLIGIGATGLLLLMGLNFQSVMTHAPAPKFISQNEVRGMAVVHEGKEYTLNFDQQTRAVNLINQSIRIRKATIAQENLLNNPYSVTLYRFDAPDINIRPLALIDRQLIFEVKEWNPEGAIRETGPGELHKLFTSLFTTP